MTKEKRIVVDIGEAQRILEASPELCQTFNELIGGKALIEAQEAAQAMLDLLDHFSTMAREALRGDRDEGQALCDINNLALDLCDKYGDRKSEERNATRIYVPDRGRTIEQAVLTERERCAQVAEQYAVNLRNGGAINACRSIANGIRSWAAGGDK